jgi:hypothetical protein
MASSIWHLLVLRLTPVCIIGSRNSIRSRLGQNFVRYGDLCDGLSIALRQSSLGEEIDFLYSNFFLMCRV